MTNGIFKNAVFGDKFKTRDGKDVIYLSSERHRDRHGNLTEWTYHNVVVNINGLQPFENMEPLHTNTVSTYVEYKDFAILSNLRGYIEDGRRERKDDIIPSCDASDGSNSMTKQDALNKIRGLKVVLPAASNEIDEIINVLSK